MKCLVVFKHKSLDVIVKRVNVLRVWWPLSFANEFTAVAGNPVLSNFAVWAGARAPLSWKMQNIIKHLNVETCLNYVSFQQNLLSFNSENLVKNLCRLSRNCILSGGTFYFEPPCIYFSCFSLQAKVSSSAFILSRPQSDIDCST